MQDPIEKLREYAAECCPEYEQYDSHMMRLADEIEAAYMKLPVDKDGVPIRVGDVMEYANPNDGDEPFTILGVNNDGDVFYGLNDKRAVPTYISLASLLRHFRPDTVESLLQEIAEEVWNTCCQNQTTWSDSGLDGIAERYAERIRKAVER